VTLGVVGIGKRHGLDDPGFEPQQGKGFSLLHNIPERPWAHPPSY